MAVRYCTPTPSMRRSTPGVLGAEQLMDARIALAEAHDPARIVQVLEPLVGEPRRARMLEVIGRRLASVAVVFDGPYDPHNGAAGAAVVRGVRRAAAPARGRATGDPFAVAHTAARGAQNWPDVTRLAAAPSLLAWAHEAGMPLVGAHPEGEPSCPRSWPTCRAAAVVLGNEREGIRAAIAAACAHRVRVPMRGFVESLNVSVTAAILLHSRYHARLRRGPRPRRAPPPLRSRPLPDRSTRRGDPPGGPVRRPRARLLVATAAGTNYVRRRPIRWQTISTRCSASPRARTRTTSRRPIGSSRGSSTPTRTRATRRPKSASRR